MKGGRLSLCGPLLLASALTVPAVGSAAPPLSRADAVRRALSQSRDLVSLESADSMARRAADVPRLLNPVARLELDGEHAGFGGADYSRRIGIEQELDLRGERGARRELGLAAVRVTTADLEARRREIALEVERGVGHWLVLERRVQWLDSLVTQASNLAARAREAASRETLMPFAARQLNLDAVRLGAERRALLGDLAAEEAGLRVVLGWPRSDSLSFLDDLDPPRAHGSGESLFQLALRSRLDLRRAAAEESLRFSEAGLEQRLAGTNPTIGISLARERSSFGSGDLLGGQDAGATFGGLDRTETRVGFSISLPLPLSNRRQAEIATAAREAFRARAERESLVRRIQVEVASANSQWETAQSQLMELRAFAAEAGSDWKRVGDAYGDGRINLQDFLVFRDRLADVTRRYLDALEAAEAARTLLSSATGLPWSALPMDSGNPEDKVNR